MSDKIPTAKEFLIQNDDEDFRLSKSGLYLSEMMIEFTKLHIEVALKEASENAETELIKYTDDYEINKHSILNAYPLENVI